MSIFSNFGTRRGMSRGVVAALLLCAAACRDRDVTAPQTLANANDPSSKAVARCDVDVVARTMTCVSVANGSQASATSRANTATSTTRPGSRSADRIVGGQDVYVKLTSTGTAYDAGTNIFSSNVSVQNLARFSMGTQDGIATLGIKVFFQQDPVVTGGTGTVTVANADGTGTFTVSNQQYFGYGQILTPYEISNTKNWQFSVSPTVTRFSFVVYVDAPMTDEIGTLLDRVWTGTTDVAWLTPTNWRDSVPPDSTSTVAIPTDSLLAPGHHSPALAADAVINNLRVGSGNTLDLGGHSLRVKGNVDAIGAISDGSVDVAGAGVIIGGSFDHLTVSGTARTQRTVATTGAVTITGALSVNDQALVIQIP